MRVRAHARGRSSGAAPQCARSRRPLRVTLRARASHRIASPRARTREPPSAWRRKAPYVRPRPRGSFPSSFGRIPRSAAMEVHPEVYKWLGALGIIDGSREPLLRVAAGRSPSMSASRPISRTDRCVAPPSPPRDPPCRPDRQSHDETRECRPAGRPPPRVTAPSRVRRDAPRASRRSLPRLASPSRRARRIAPRLVPLSTDAECASFPPPRSPLFFH